MSVFPILLKRVGQTKKRQSLIDIRKNAESSLGRKMCSIDISDFGSISITTSGCIDLL